MRKLAGAGVQPQRLLWASTGTKDPRTSDVLYTDAIAAPSTINTMPEETLRAFADHRKTNDVFYRKKKTMLPPLTFWIARRWVGRSEMKGRIDMAIDPICGMTVDEASALHTERD